MSDVWTNDYYKDLKLAAMADDTDKVCLCSALPTTETEAESTYMLAEAAVTPGDGNDFTIGDVSGGRRATLAAKTGVSVTNTGVATHIAWVDNGSRLVHVSKLSTGFNVTAAGTCNIPATTYDDMDTTLT